jgi:hypothetical protein
VPPDGGGEEIAAVRVDQVHLRVEEANFRMLSRGAGISLELCRIPPIIRVEERNPFTRRTLDGEIPRWRDAASGTAHVLNPISELLLEQCLGVVGPVVDDEYLEVVESLADDAPDRMKEFVAPIERRYDDGK